MNMMNNYKESVWFRSLVQAIPYVGPLIDNALTMPLSQNERANQEAFLSALSKEVLSIKTRLSTTPESRAHPETLLPRVLELVRSDDAKYKTGYYQNIFLSFEFYRSLDRTAKIDVFPRHFLKMTNEYTLTHFRTIKTMHENYFPEHIVWLRQGDLVAMTKDLNLPGACLFKILNDFERDLLLDVEYANGRKEYSLACIEALRETLLCDEFYMCVIEPPWKVDTPNQTLQDTRDP